MAHTDEHARIAVPDRAACWNSDGFSDPDGDDPQAYGIIDRAVEITERRIREVDATPPARTSRWRVGWITCRIL